MRQFLFLRAYVTLVNKKLGPSHTLSLFVWCFCKTCVSGVGDEVKYRSTNFLQVPSQSRYGVIDHTLDNWVFKIT